MTFDEWHKANAKYMEPVDIVDWCREAYEAGRADENEACAKMFNDNESEILWGSQAASAIRVRREQ